MTLLGSCVTDDGAAEMNVCVLPVSFTLSFFLSQKREGGAGICLYVDMKVDDGGVPGSTSSCRQHHGVDAVLSPVSMVQAMVVGFGASVLSFLVAVLMVCSLTHDRGSAPPEGASSKPKNFGHVISMLMLGGHNILSVVLTLTAMQECICSLGGLSLFVDCVSQ